MNFHISILYDYARLYHSKKGELKYIDAPVTDAISELNTFINKLESIYGKSGTYGVMQNDRLNQIVNDKVVTERVKDNLPSEWKHYIKDKKLASHNSFFLYDQQIDYYKTKALLMLSYDLGYPETVVANWKTVVSQIKSGAFYSSFLTQAELDSFK